MSTAARPTYFAAVGKSSYGGIRSRHISAKDQNGQTQLKFRQIGQSSVEEMREKDLRQELEKNEQINSVDKNNTMSLIQDEEKKVDVTLLLKNKPELDEEVLKKYDDADVDDDRSDGSFDESSEEEDDDDDDDEEELQAELERIREERAIAQAKKEEEERMLAEQISKDSALKGNPLLNINNQNDLSAKIKRRWNEDVVFRNQAKDEPDHKKRFINDTIRSDFHRSFLKKFIK